MVRYGAAVDEMQPFKNKMLFLANVKLLVIMAKACLKNYPLGENRKKAIQDTAHSVFYDALYHGSHSAKGSQDLPVQNEGGEAEQAEHLFYQRAQLLSVMMKSLAAQNPQGDYRRRAIAENIDCLCDYFSDQLSLRQVPFLKVA